MSEQTVEDVLAAIGALLGLSTRWLGVLADEVSVTQYRALVVLAAGGPQRVLDLAHLMDTTSSSVVRLCDGLVGKGLVRRQRSRADRRIVSVSLSGEGRRVVDEITAPRGAMIKSLFAAVPIERQRLAADAFQYVARAVGAAQDDRRPGIEMFVIAEHAAETSAESSVETGGPRVRTEGGQAW